MTKVFFRCWSCGKEYDSETIPFQHGYKCDCGGYVISPSGKIQGRWIDESTAYGNDCPTGKCEWWGIP